MRNARQRVVVLLCRMAVYAVSAFLCGKGSRWEDAPGLVSSLLCLLALGFGVAAVYQMDASNRAFLEELAVPKGAAGDVAERTVEEDTVLRKGVWRQEAQVPAVRETLFLSASREEQANSRLVLGKTQTGE